MAAQTPPLYADLPNLGRVCRPDREDRFCVSELLSILIEKYEATLVLAPEVSQGQLLEHLLEARQLTAAHVAKATGVSANLLSNVRAGRRELSKDNIRKLSEFFNVSPAVWL